MANPKGRLKTSKKNKNTLIRSRKLESRSKTKLGAMKHSSELEVLSPNEKVDLLIRSGHLTKGKFKRLHKIKRTGKDCVVENKNILLEKARRIKKSNGNHLTVLNSLLKNELLVCKVKSPVELTFNITSNNYNNDLNRNSDITDNPSSVFSDVEIDDKKISFDAFTSADSNYYQCDHCQKKFKTKSNLIRHIVIHYDQKPYHCLHCPRQFKQYCNLRQHMRRVHSEVWSTERVYKCHKCKKSFSSKENLSTHLTQHVNKKNNSAYKCILCNECFPKQTLLFKHEEIHLLTGKYQCTICNVSYNCRSRLAIHSKSHLRIKESICQYCGKEFLRPNSVMRHIDACHVDRRIQCPICKKNLKGHLTEHINTHNKRKPHICPECGQRFTQSTQLNVHRRMHSGARPYLCRICQRSFSHSNALALHIRRHTGEKPFSCAMCPLTFSQLPHMKAHMRNIHGKVNPYKCERCREFFKLKAELDSHRKSCKVGQREMTFEEKIEASVLHEEVEVEPPMTISRMRFLVALLFSMIASKKKLQHLGFNKRLIDDLLIQSIEAMGHPACTDPNLTPFNRLKANIDILLSRTIPKDQMLKFSNEQKTTEQLLELLTGEKK